MRGKDGDARVYGDAWGITPAYAGKSGNRLTIHVKRRDHPRLCGEKTATSQLVDEIVGSPPPMRGKARLTPSRALSKGITPAYAGKSHMLHIPQN